MDATGSSLVANYLQEQTISSGWHIVPRTSGATLVRLVTERQVAVRHTTLTRSDVVVLTTCDVGGGPTVKRSLLTPACRLAYGGIFSPYHRSFISACLPRQKVQDMST